MSLRSNGSYIGPRPAGPSESAASGIWDLRTVERQRAANNWPGQPITDPDFASVSLLLHMDGSNGSTTFTDSSSNSLSVTANGNAQISTAQSKFGGASGYFDGSGDYIATGTDAALTFGSGSFTIEFWIRPTGTQPANPRIMGNLSANAFNAGDWVLTQNLNYGLYAASYNGGATPIVTLGSSATDDVWTHIAIVRDGNDFEMFKDGVSVGTNTWSGSLDSGTRRFVVGSSGNTTESWKGYIDDLRITKGVARYTANFTPPTAAFPDA